MRWTLASAITLGIFVSLACAVETGRPRPHMYTTAEAALEHDADFIVQGEYSGTVRVGEDSRRIGIQVIARGNGQFRAVRYEGGLPGDGWGPLEPEDADPQAGDTPTLGGREPVFINPKLEHKPQQRGPRSRAETQRDGDDIIFRHDDWVATWQPDALVITDAEGRQLGRLDKVQRQSPTLGQDPPDGATVLFDGTTAEHWHRGRIVLDDLLFRGVTSREAFGKKYLHVEFRLPYMPRARGQGRANSGVYVQRRYEVQILDSFGLDGTAAEGGGIYAVRAPEVNMAFPPLTWETYDIYFKPPQFDNGRKVANARMTVYHNGVLIHDDVEVPRQTGGGRPEGPDPGPIYLQDHGEPVVFRNVWLVPLDEQ